MKRTASFLLAAPAKKARRATSGAPRARFVSAVEQQQIIGGLSATWGTVGTTWVQNNINGCSAGSGFSQRRGRTISINSIVIKGQLVGGQGISSADDLRNTVRMVLWQGVPAASLATSGITLNMPCEPPFVQGMQRLLADKQIILASPGPGPVAGVMPAVRNIFIRYKFKTPLKVTYADDNAGSFDKVIYFSMLSDSSVVPSPGFVNGYYQIKYTDV